MTHQEILEKAIQKAIDNGWNIKTHWIVAYPKKEYLIYLDNPKFLGSLIYDHDFARALWGDLPTYIHSGFERYSKGKRINSWLGEANEAIKDEKFVTGAVSYTSWQYHLQQMVIADDPIAYLGEHL